MKRRSRKSQGLKTRHPKQKDSTVVTVGLILHNNHRLLVSTIRQLDQLLKKSYEFYEILLVDNGSKDPTFETIKKLQRKYPVIRALILSRQYHRESAFLAIFEHAIGDYLVLMDIATDPIVEIPNLMSKAISGYDIVTGVPSRARKKTFLEKSSFAVLNKIAKNSIGFEVVPNAPYFRVLSRKVVNSIIRYRNKRRYLTYLNAVVGFNQTSIRYKLRRHKSSMSLWQSWRLILDVIFSNSSAPLKLASFLGAASSFMYMIYVFVVALVKKDVAEGWITVSVLNSSMFFLLFVILMILSEYIDRLIYETKDQPMYIVADELTSSDLSHQHKRLNIV